MKCEKQISYNRPAADLVLPESPELERAVLGALILSALKIGLVVVGMDTFYQYIATGLIIIVAVYFETIQKNLSKIMGKKKA